MTQKNYSNEMHVFRKNQQLKADNDVARESFEGGDCTIYDKVSFYGRDLKLSKDCNVI